LKYRKEKEERKQFLRNENQRARKLIKEIILNDLISVKTEFYYGQVLYIPINNLRRSYDHVRNTWLEDETIDCNICKCTISRIYPNYNIPRSHRFDINYIRNTGEIIIRLAFENGNERHYNKEYFTQRIEMSKNFGIENKLSWYDEKEKECEFQPIYIKNQKYWFDEKGEYSSIKNLVLTENLVPYGIFDKISNEIYKCNFEDDE